MHYFNLFQLIFSLSTVLKSYGQQLKAPAAMVRLRLYETLTLLPANSLESSYTHLLRMLVAEFTLTENPANTTNSLLRELCHSDDSIILGTWLQETDHRTIEDQVCKSTESIRSIETSIKKCPSFNVIFTRERFFY